MRAILVDDEKRSRRVLRNLLTDFSESITVLGEFPDLATAVEGIRDLQPDVVFLDVQMPNYAGYEIVNFIDPIDFRIVFVTAYDQYAIKAFELSATDYLLKPINRSRLSITIDRLYQDHQNRNRSNSYEELVHNLEHRKQRKIVLPESGDRRVLNLEEVVAIQADGSYAVVHLRDKPPITVSKNLKYFEELLDDDATFFRSHRAWIINLNHLQVQNRTGNDLLLSNGTRAKLSRSRHEPFYQALKS